MVMVAVLVPAAEGSKVILKVVEPAAAIGVVGTAVTVKSAELVPEITIYGLAPVRLSAAVPILSMVKVLVRVPVLTSTVPKSVWSVVAGVESPSITDTPFPFTFHFW